MTDRCPDPCLTAVGCRCREAEADDAVRRAGIFDPVYKPTPREWPADAPQAKSLQRVAAVMRRQA